VNKLLNTELLTLRTLFQAQGWDLRFVGGCVRDVMSGKEPKDVDLHTDANPLEQVAIYQAADVHYIETGLKHGTVTVVLNNVAYEITSLRQDAETDGRHATVAYTRDWYTDLERRDFRFNAMSMGFDGDLMDPFDGLSNLQTGLVQFVGDPAQRIKEDYLRILRWFRFRGRFGMVMNYSDQRAIEKLAPGLQSISRERVWSEMSRILAGDNGPWLMLEMHQGGLSQYIDLPHDSFGPNQMDAIDFADDVAELTRNPVTLMVALYGEQAAYILTKWHASSDEIRLATWLNVQHGSMRRLQDLMAVDGVRRDWVMELAALRQEAGTVMVRNMLAVWTVPVFPVNGNDLLALGYRAGPVMGDVLRYLRDAWAKSDYHMTRNDLLEFQKSFQLANP